MTKLISILIILVVIFGGWQIFRYWEKVQAEHDSGQKEAAATVVVPQQLQGMPYELQQSLDAAESKGATALFNWLKAYDSSLQDPRKAWIELDYCVMVARDNPAEAKRVYAAVRARVSHSSPVWPRIEDLAKSYQ